VALKRIAVIGGGISGLVAAFELAKARRAGAGVEEYLIEGGPRLGGALRSERVSGCLVEAGADSFLTEKREAAEFCREVGLGDDLMGSNDADRRTWILHRGRLEPLPDGLEFFVPSRPMSILRTRLLSWKDKLGLASEFLQRPRRAPEESVAAFVRRHFGEGLLETIVEPLLAAVYGGDSRELSARATLARLVQMEESTGSLIRALRHNRRPASAARPPLFTTLRNGLDSLAAVVQGQLEPSRVRCGLRVEAVSRLPNGGFELRASGETLQADAVIFALAAHEAGRLLAPLDSSLGQHLSDIPYSSSLIVAVGYDSLVDMPPGFGFLVPEKEGLRLRACTFVGRKFPSRVPPGRALFRCFYGGVRDEAALELSDEEVATMVRADLRRILRLEAEPLFVRVYRWPRAIAQYTLGHLDRVAAIRSRVAGVSGVFLCGNYFDGIGIADCVRSGRAVATECLKVIDAGSPTVV
jgi:oxygen-dependent protoporphyrinogen oxidase